MLNLMLTLFGILNYLIIINYHKLPPGVNVLSVSVLVESVSCLGPFRAGIGSSILATLNRTSGRKDDE